MADLSELGLSNYEARVYRTLLALGSAPATDVSDASEVPRGRIYDVLNGLEARGLVRAHEAREPTRYAAVDPETAVDRLLAERERDLAQRRQRYEAVAEAVTAELAATVPTESRFWTAPLGSDAAVSLAAEQFDLADDRIDSVVGVPYTGADWEHYAAELDAMERVANADLDVRMLVGERLAESVPDAARERVFGLADGVVIRATPDPQVTVDVLDGETVYVHVTDPFDATERLGVVAVREPGFAGTLQTAFEDAWQAARPLE